MARFNLADYETVEERLEKFWQAHPEGRIISHFISDPTALDEVVICAEVFADRTDDRPVSTGLAFERRGTNMSEGANFTSHVENCETSAIGRALANWTYKARRESPRPSASEMAKVERMGGTPQGNGSGTQVPAGSTKGQTNTSGVTCPNCGAPPDRMHVKPNCPTGPTPTAAAMQDRLANEFPDELLPVPADHPSGPAH